MSSKSSGKKLEGFFTGKGFYIVLFLCAAVIGVSAWMMADGNETMNGTSSTGSAGMEYIAGINYLYEFDLGELSGWTYRVNGTSPSVGCGSYHPADGDTVEWIYTDGAGFNTRD